MVRVSFTIKIVAILVMGFINCGAQSLYLEENFNYGNSVGDLTSLSTDWNAHSAPGSNPVQYSAAGLNYSGYLSSNIGGSAQYSGGSGSREDVNRVFTSQNSGAVYVSFLVNFSSVTSAADGDYFFHLDSTLFTARVFVKRNGSLFSFGLSKSGTSPFTNGDSTSFIYNIDSTYLLVLKYTFNNSSLTDDIVDLFVNPQLDGAEPAPTLSTGAGDSDADSLYCVSLRQGGSAYSLSLDGIRVSNTWMLSSLPVELSLFTARYNGSVVRLRWRTETEINNYGFELERSNKTGGQEDEWKKIAFIDGSGNSNTPHMYMYEDENIPAGNYRYRLKEIDNDGAFRYSEIVSVRVGTSLKMMLYQNYPNPFNPSTRINYTLARSGRAELKVYDLLGREAAVLFQGVKHAGSYSVEFNSKRLIKHFTAAAGIYFCVLRSGGTVKSIKMILIK